MHILQNKLSSGFLMGLSDTLLSSCTPSSAKTPRLPVSQTPHVCGLQANRQANHAPYSTRTQSNIAKTQTLFRQPTERFSRHRRSDATACISKSARSTSSLAEFCRWSQRARDSYTSRQKTWGSHSLGPACHFRLPFFFLARSTKHTSKQRTEYTKHALSLLNLIGCHCVLVPKPLPPRQV